MSIVLALLQKQPTKASVKVGSTMYTCRKGEGVISVTSEPSYSKLQDARIKIQQISRDLGEQERLMKTHAASMSRTEHTDAGAFATAKEKFDACFAKAAAMKGQIEEYQAILAAAEQEAAEFKRETVTIPSDMSVLTVGVSW